MLTEVNLNVATYVSFEGISNAFVDAVRPSRLPFGSPGGPTGQTAARPLGSQLDTSFNVHLTLGNALEQLHSSQLQSGQQTPALGKFPFFLCSSLLLLCLGRRPLDKCGPRRRRRRPVGLSAARTAITLHVQLGDDNDDDDDDYVLAKLMNIKPESSLLSPGQDERAKTQLAH